MSIVICGINFWTVVGRDSYLDMEVMSILENRPTVHELPPCSTSAEMLTPQTPPLHLASRCAEFRKLNLKGGETEGGSGAADGAQNLRRDVLEQPGRSHKTVRIW